MKLEQNVSMILWCIMGVFIFSFLDVIICRIPKHMDFGSIVSWNFLKQKCQYHHIKESRRDILVEILGGIFAFLSWYLWGNSLKTVLFFLFFCMLTVISFVDWDTMLIPNRLVIAMLSIAILSCFVPSELTVFDRFIGFFSISLPMLLLIIVVPGAFGGGDIKLMAVAGIFLGWKLCILSFFLGVIVGGIYGIYLLAIKKKGRKDHFPFGPFLCFGMFCSILFGNELITWYFLGLI